jgi:hypothetical protein
MTAKFPRPISFQPDLHIAVRKQPKRAKTQTRRLIKFNKNWESEFNKIGSMPPPWLPRSNSDKILPFPKCPYGKNGDLLYIAEPLYRDASGHIRYQLDHAKVLIQGNPVEWTWTPRSLPGRYMPRWAIRDLITIQEVEVQRLHEISEKDAQAEEVENLDQFIRLWNAINGKRASWESNPWVWALTFPEQESQDLSILEIRLRSG